MMFWNCTEKESTCTVQHRSEHRERSAVANTQGFRKPPGQVKGTAAVHLSGEALRTVRWAPHTPKSCSKATSV